MSDHDDATVDVKVSPAAVVLPPSADPIGDARRELAEQLVEEARATGVNLVGPGGLLADLTKRVLETGLEVEMTEHIGYEKHAGVGANALPAPLGVVLGLVAVYRQVLPVLGTTARSVFTQLLHDAGILADPAAAATC